MRCYVSQGVHFWQRIYIYTDVYIYMYIYDICLYVYMYMCICVYICIYVYMYTCIHVYMYICIYVYTYIHIYIYTYICIYVYMYICKYTFVYTPTHTMSLRRHSYTCQTAVTTRTCTTCTSVRRALPAEHDVLTVITHVFSVRPNAGPCLQMNIPTGTASPLRFTDRPGLSYPLLARLSQQVAIVQGFVRKLEGSGRVRGAM